MQLRPRQRHACTANTSCVFARPSLLFWSRVSATLCAECFCVWAYVHVAKHFMFYSNDVCHINCKSPIHHLRHFAKVQNLTCCSWLVQATCWAEIARHIVSHICRVQPRQIVDIFLLSFLIDSTRALFVCWFCFVPWKWLTAIPKNPTWWPSSKMTLTWNCHGYDMLGQTTSCVLMCSQLAPVTLARVAVAWAWNGKDGWAPTRLHWLLASHFITDHLSRWGSTESCEVVSGRRPHASPLVLLSNLSMDHSLWSIIYGHICLGQWRLRRRDRLTACRCPIGRRKGNPRVEPLWNKILSYGFHTKALKKISLGKWFPWNKTQPAIQD